MPCCAEKDTGFCRPAPSTRRPEDIPDPNGTKRLDACPTAAGGCPMRRIVAGLQCGVSAPSVPLRRSEIAAYGRTCPASFRHRVTEKCPSAARPLADPASGSLASHPFTAAGHSATGGRHRVGFVSSWAAAWRAPPPPVPVRSWRTPPETANRIAADSKRPRLPKWG